jgi:predicted PurR-regulated permease PerM
MSFSNDFFFGLAFGVLLTLVILPLFRWLSGLQRWWPLVLIVVAVIACGAGFWFFGRG